MEVLNTIEYVLSRLATHAFRRMIFADTCAKLQPNRNKGRHAKVDFQEKPVKIERIVLWVPSFVPIGLEISTRGSKRGFCERCALLDVFKCTEWCSTFQISDFSSIVDCK